MSELSEFEQRIQDKLAQQEHRVRAQKDGLGERMMEVTRRHQAYTALADRLMEQVIRPRLARLPSYFENAELVPSEQAGRHQAACVFKHCARFPATARLELSLSRDGQAEKLALLYRAQIRPLFLDFPSSEEKWLPLGEVKDEHLAAWVEEKVVQFLDAYLRLETHDQYQAENLVTDPVCNMCFNKAHAAGCMEYHGREYYFCVADCQQQFAADPDRYLVADKQPFPSPKASSDPAARQQEIHS
jgi:YHS domain-containing protein